MTAHQRHTIQTADHRVRVWILFKPRMTSGPQLKLAVKWLDGFWFGFNARTGQHIVSDKAAVTTCRGIRRRNREERHISPSAAPFYATWQSPHTPAPACATQTPTRTSDHTQNIHRPTRTTAWYAVRGRWTGQHDTRAGTRRSRANLDKCCSSTTADSPQWKWRQREDPRHDQPRCVGDETPGREALDDFVQLVENQTHSGRPGSAPKLILDIEYISRASRALAARDLCGGQQPPR